jgi:hypothetical protein
MQIPNSKIQFIIDQNLYVLRDKNKRAVDVSYSPYGLTLSTNYVGRPYLAPQASFKVHEDKDTGKKYLRLEGKIELNNGYTIERFKPRIRDSKMSASLRASEVSMVRKALDLLYGVEEEPISIFER